MNRCLRLFSGLTSIAQFKEKQIVILLNKLDLFKQRIAETPVAKYFPNYSGGSNYNTACKFFADEFAKQDQRPDGKLCIFSTSAVDEDDFKKTYGSILPFLVEKGKTDVGPASSDLDLNDAVDYRCRGSKRKPRRFEEKATWKKTCDGSIARGDGD